MFGIAQCLLIDPVMRINSFILFLISETYGLVEAYVTEEIVIKSYLASGKNINKKKLIIHYLQWTP